MLKTDGVAPSPGRASCRLCRMPVDICLCDVSPRLDLKTKIVIFMHQKEFRLLTNTGVLARRVLQNSQIVYRGDQKIGRVARETFLSDTERENAFVLYPAGEAITLSPDFIRSRKAPLTLICPDGHWAQAKKILRHEPSLKDLPCVKLPEGMVTRYRLRRGSQLGRVCTFEAVMAALGLIEGEAVRDELETIFEKMVTRILWTRGKIRSDQVVW